MSFLKQPQGVTDRTESICGTEALHRFSAHAQESDQIVALQRKASSACVPMVVGDSIAQTEIRDEGGVPALVTVLKYARIQQH